MEEQVDQTKLRDMKFANGEVVKITEEEFERVFEVFRMLRDTDRRILKEAVNGAKVTLTPLYPDSFKKYVGKKVFVSVRVTEEIQMKHWDHYYKLEKVTLDGYSLKNNTVKVKTLKGDPIEIEARDLFVEVDAP